MKTMTDEQRDTYKIAKASVMAVKRYIESSPSKKMMEIYEEIALDFGMTGGSLRKRYGTWKKLGDSSLIPKPKGRKEGDGKFLSDEMEEKIIEIITDRTPDQIKMPFALWSRQAVQELILEKYNIELVITAVGKYLKKWGFTVQKPSVKKPGQQPAAVERWLNEEYPSIQKQAKIEDATIFWGDETAVQNEPNLMRGYSKRGVTPVVVGPRKRLHLHMISAVSNQGAVKFRIYDSAINMDRFKDFLQKMILDSKGKKVIMILDNLRVHHARDLQPWLIENKHLIELKFLPAYSPEMNPDEYLNRDMKSRLANKPGTSNSKVLENNVLCYMDMLEKNAELVQSFFHDKKVRYAA
jgi:transposase